MADQKIKKLARNLSQVKNLSSDVNINSYYTEIKPFLFGVPSNDQTILDKNNLPNGGLYSVLNTGSLIPSESPKVIIKVSGKSTTNYKIPNVRSTQFIEDLQPKEDGSRVKRPGEYFFPSDAVRTLTGLARIFYQSKYNVDELKTYASGSSDNLDFVKKWGKVNTNPELVEIDTGYFYEENFITYYQTDVKKLLDAVINAAVLFENSDSKINLTGFDLQSEVEKLVINEIVSEIYEAFKEKSLEYLKSEKNYEEVIKPILESKDKEYLNKEIQENKQKLSREVSSIINNNKIDFLRVLFSNQQNLNYFKEIGAYEPEMKYFLFETRPNPKQIGIKETEIYKTFVSDSIKKFLEDNSKKLTDEYLLPLFKKENNQELFPEEFGNDGGASDIVEEVEFDHPLDLETFKKKIIEIVTNKIIENYKTNFLSSHNPNFHNIKNTLPPDYLVSLATEVYEDAIEKINDELLFEEEELIELQKKGLYSGENFNPEIINSEWYSTLINDSIDFLSNQPSPDPQFSTYFIYLYEKHLSPLIDLITPVQNPISVDDFKKRLSKDISINIVRDFIDNYIPTRYEGDFSIYRDRIVDNYIQPVENHLIEEIINNLSSFEINEIDLPYLANLRLYTLNQFDKRIFEHQWYLDKIIDLSPNLLNTLRPQFSELYRLYIDPALALYELETEDQSENEEDIAVTQRQSGSVIPPDITQAPETTIVSDNINDLTNEQKRSLQYESAWMYNRAVYELFTSQGISIEELDQNTLNNLQSHVFNFIAEMQLKQSKNESNDFSKLFASSSYRQKALLEFYKKTGYKINTFANTQDILSYALKRSFNVDSPVLTENIKNTVDSLIIQYGLNQDFFAFDPNNQEITKYSGENNHDIIWFIENIPANRLALIFNLPSGLVFNNETIDRLKKALKEYSLCRASELSLSIQSTSLQKGLVVISNEDAEKIKNGDQETITKHLSFTNYLRDMSKENGSETVAGALDHKENGNKEKIQKQYKTFLPLWEQLNGLEQYEIYKHFNIPVPPEFAHDKSRLEVAKLEFIPEFIFFDITKLGDIKKILAQKELSESKKEEILEIIAIQNQLIREKELAELINKEYSKSSDRTEYIEIANKLGFDYDNSSFREKFTTDELIQQEGSSDYDLQEVGPGRGGFIPRILDSKRGKKLKERFNRRFKKKVSPTKKATKAFGAAAGAGIDKVAAASLNLLPGIGTALSAGLLAIRNKKLRNAISSFITLGLGLIIGRTIWAFGSIGGFIGGWLGGGIAALASGTTMAIPGFIAGANIGEAVLPARISDFWNGSKNNIPTKGPVGYQNSNPSSENSYNPPPKGRTLGKLATSYEGLSLIAVGGFSVSIIFVTLFIVLIIQSAFIIPIPQNRLASGNPVGELGPEGFGCFKFAGPGEKVETEFGDQFQSVSWSADEKERVFQAYSRKAGQNSCFNSYVCSGGDILLYRLSGRQYGGWAPSQEPIGGKALFLYDLPFQSADGVAYSNIDGLEYTFIHELGHILDYKKINDFSNRFQQIWDLNNKCLTYPYPAACNLGEAFAESITLFINHEYYEYHTIEGISYGRNNKRLYDFPNEAPAEYEWVKENIFCNEPILEQGDSYLAIGPLQRDNIVVSTKQEIQNPGLTCAWASGKNLDVAINANFFNTVVEDGKPNKYIPVGIAGYCQNGSCSSPIVEYYQDSTVSTFNPHLKSFGFTKAGQFKDISGIDNMKTESSNLSMAVTGSYSDTQTAPDSSNKRTIIGKGTATSECSEEFAGQEVMFMGVFPNATFAQAEQRLKDCGATTLIHLDGGGSSQFCSSEVEYSQFRDIPVNMGMKNAEIIIGGGEGSEL